VVDGRSYPRLLIDGENCFHCKTIEKIPV